MPQKKVPGTVVFWKNQLDWNAVFFDANFCLLVVQAASGVACVPGVQNRSSPVHSACVPLPCPEQVQASVFRPSSHSQKVYGGKGLLKGLTASSFPVYNFCFLYLFRRK